MVRQMLQSRLGLALAGLTFGASPLQGQRSYDSQGAQTVSYLLGRVSDYTFFTCPTCNDGHPPDVTLLKGGQRDIYVAAAVTYAWAAENYARLGNDRLANEAAAQMLSNIKQANELCSDAADLAGQNPATLQVWPCPAPITE